MSRIILTIACKKSDNKAFKGQEDSNWYNLNDNVVPYLEKMSKGDKIEIEFEKKGVSRYVSKIAKAGAVAKQETEETGFACEVCGAALKDGKYKKCYTCNKSGATKKETPKEETTSTDKPTCKVCGKELKDDKYDTCYVCAKKSGKSSYGKGKTNYDSPEKTAQIQRGNALNAAASVASGQVFADPEAASEYTLILADRFLDYLRAE